MKNKTLSDLEDVYFTHGHKSLEFANHIKPYVHFLVNRYFRDFLTDENLEDIIQGCYDKINYSISNHFNPEKGNLATFIHYSVRNYLSTEKKEAVKLSNIVKDYDMIDVCDEEKVLEVNSKEYDFYHLDCNVSKEEDIEKCSKELTFSTFRVSSSLAYKYLNNLIDCPPLRRFLRWKA